MLFLWIRETDINAVDFLKPKRSNHVLRDINDWQLMGEGRCAESRPPAEPGV